MGEWGVSGVEVYGNVTLNPKVVHLNPAPYVCRSDVVGERHDIVSEVFTSGPTGQVSVQKSRNVPWTVDH